MTAKLGRIVVFVIRFDSCPNRIHRGCILRRIETSQKRGDSNRKTKRNEAKRGELFDMIRYKKSNTDESKRIIIWFRLEKSNQNE